MHHMQRLLDAVTHDHINCLWVHQSVPKLRWGRQGFCPGWKNNRGATIALHAFPLPPPALSLPPLYLFIFMYMCIYIFLVISLASAAFQEGTN